MPTTAPYGSWASPISAELVASAGVSLDELVVDGDAVYWLEGRPLATSSALIGDAQEP